MKNNSHPPSDEGSDKDPTEKPSPKPTKKPVKPRRRRKIEISVTEEEYEKIRRKWGSLASQAGKQFLLHQRVHRPKVSKEKQLEVGCALALHRQHVRKIRHVVTKVDRGKYSQLLEGEAQSFNNLTRIWFSSFSDATREE